MGNHETQVLIFQSQGAMRDFVISRWSEISARSIEKNGVFRAALSGGETPVALYERLAEEEGLDWDKTELYQVDERFVPEDDPDSNFRMIRRTLIDRINIPAGNIIRVPADAPDPLIAAERYETLIREKMGLSEGQLPRFDLVLLGIGKDGHTASLFPGDDLLFEKCRIAAPAFPESAKSARSGRSGHSRVTITFPVINRARHIFFLVIGKEKAPAFKKAVTGDPAVPAALVKPMRGELVFIADRQAGSGLQ